tara:strand:+ start:571 stop:765 length:195 start_codon:yes stop_codon:yes gene_type:complete
MASPGLRKRRRAAALAAEGKAPAPVVEPVVEAEAEEAPAKEEPKAKKAPVKKEAKKKSSAKKAD